jgi:hypothetical protein
MKRVHLIIVALLLIAWGALCQRRPLAVADESRANNDAVLTNVVKAAKQALQSTQAAYETGHASGEDVDRGSRRLMAAEVKANPGNKAAITEHVLRMRKLNEHVEARFKAGVEGGQQVAMDAANYYLEAAIAELREFNSTGLE